MPARMPIPDKILDNMRLMRLRIENETNERIKKAAQEAYLNGHFWKCKTILKVPVCRNPRKGWAWFEKNFPKEHGD